MFAATCGFLVVFRIQSLFLLHTQNSGVAARERLSMASFVTTFDVLVVTLDCTLLFVCCCLELPALNVSVTYGNVNPPGATLLDSIYHLVMDDQSAFSVALVHQVVVGFT